MRRERDNQGESMWFGLGRKHIDVNVKRQSDLIKGFIRRTD